MSKGLELYQPSNGTEGDWFMARFCEQCVKDKPQGKCGILFRAMTLDVDEKGYPKQWCYDANGKPTCTAFRSEPYQRTGKHRKAKGQLSMNLDDGQEAANV